MAAICHWEEFPAFEKKKLVLVVQWAISVISACSPPDLVQLDDVYDVDVKWCVYEPFLEWKIRSARLADSCLFDMCGPAWDKLGESQQLSSFFSAEDSIKLCRSWFLCFFLSARNLNFTFSWVSFLSAILLFWWSVFNLQETVFSLANT